MIESWGRQYETLGMTYNFGRCFALAMVATDPLSQEDFAEALGISQSVVSTSLRPLMAIGMLEKVRIPGVRAARYRIPSDAATVLARIQAKRMEILRGLMSEAAALELPEPARERVANHLSLWEYFENNMHELIERWEAGQQ
jgi:DNA-binding transcriptional regulator GbsR (MarR family)